DHRDRPGTAPENALVVVPLAGTDPAANAGRIVAGGTAFVLAPQLAPAGTRLAWIAWDQPDMPWDATRLYVAGVAADGGLEHSRCAAGAQGGESIAGARWAPD